jgi:hypothetical protein
MALQPFASAVKSLHRQISKISLKSQASDDTSPKAHQAFASMATMLSAIQSTTTYSDTDLRPFNAEDRQELRILNALATICVRQYEVVAVVANRGEGSGTLQVFACVRRGDHEKSPISPQPSGPSNSIWRFFVSPNPRRSESFDKFLVPQEDVPTIIDPHAKLHSQPSLCNMQKIKEYVMDDHW